MAEFLKPEYTAVVLAAVVWYVIFVLAPNRSYKAGVQLDDLPLTLKMTPFRVIQAVALLVLCGAAFALPTKYSFSKDTVNQFLTLLSNGALAGPLAALGIHVFLMFIVPIAIASARQKKEVPPGEWLTPALVFYRWAWVGIILLVSFGLFPDTLQANLGDPASGLPLDVVWGIVIPVVAAVLYLLYWGFPGSATAKLVGEGNPHAMDSLSRVRWLGLPAFLGMKARAKKADSEGGPKKSRKLCPSCMRPIDAIEAYDSLKFDTCPNCGELIPPVYTLEEYITSLCEKVLAINAATTEKDKAKARGGKQETDLVQRVMRAALTMALRARGTDVHISGEEGQTVFKVRTDGMLSTMLELPGDLQRLIIGTIKVMSNLDISEKRKPQDGSFKSMIDGVKLDVRVNTSPTSGGESAALRLLYQNTVLGRLDTLGMTPRTLKVAAEVIMLPHGLVLVTGPTGSGKSTTLYNSLATIADGQRNIITLEDPIEYKLDGITQMQIDQRKNFDFATGLRTILRQDPDVIMVGEIRDAETAKMAIDAAMTGHLVFSTLHTIDTTTTIGRLQDLQVDPHRHADALALLVSQRLLRIVCPQCSHAVMMSAQELQTLGLAGGPEVMEVRKGTGCSYCNQTGYFGRNGIYELLRPDDTLKEMIANRESPAQIKTEARRRGMRTLLEDGLVKVALGRTTVEEVLRVTS